MSLLEAGSSIAGWIDQTIPLSYGSLDDGRVHTYALIDRLREQAPITLVCCAFDVPTSCFYDYLARKRTINRERIQQRSELRRLFKESRDSAGSRALMSMMRELGRFSFIPSGALTLWSSN